MLTATDVHHIVGLLSRATNPASVDVEMGSTVWDEASETNRDVDVTITVRNPDGSASVFKGIEVKAHSRKLGSEMVEQLSQKLNDMPSITHRAIVSASGFTRPAIRKAKKHRVELYELREWRTSDDFEHFHHEPVPAVYSEYGWSQSIGAHINPSDPVPNEYRAAFQSDPVVVLDSGEQSSPLRLSEWLKGISRTAAKHAEEHMGPQVSEGIEQKSASVTIRFTDRAWALVGETKVPIREVRFTGVIERRTFGTQSTHKALYRRGDKRPIAGCCISDCGEFGLLALIITEYRTIELALVSVAERNKQKILRRRLMKYDRAE
jgi:hypothetical protein